ncbi:MAG: chemotaxis-specific protein-glutamate methyltransferase CheB [Nitrosomonadales bacterium]|nr:chemotaxis-specific protein-glutamate methyltransferase CheB [Nitrosomonadales bacterium]
MIKVLVVEDSAVVRELLVHILSSDPGIRIVGTANDGESAIDAAQRLRPDVITMDIHMPKMDGLEATRRIMEVHPVPIVIVSGSSDPDDVAMTFRATEAGAVAFLRKPPGIGHPEHEITARELTQTVGLMSEIKVVRRWPQMRRETAAARPPEIIPIRTPVKVGVVALGASTGGPPALQTILAGLPGDFPAPVLIVQHMASGFVHGFAEWLGQSSALPVRLAAHGETILPGHVYIAPDEFQMKVERGGKITLSKDAPESSLRPSVSYLFRSLVESYGGEAVAILLTGMGRDGAEELKLLRDRGAVTIAQDKESSVVHGMPGEAIKLDAATLILAPDKIAAVLAGLANNPAGLANNRDKKENQ